MLTWSNIPWSRMSSISVNFSSSSMSWTVGVWLWCKWEAIAYVTQKSVIVMMKTFFKLWRWGEKFGRTVHISWLLKVFGRPLDDPCFAGNIWFGFRRNLFGRPSATRATPWNKPILNLGISNRTRPGPNKVIFCSYIWINFDLPGSNSDLINFWE